MTERSAAMTDLDCIEYAVQVTLLKCRRANPNHMSIPSSGETVMKWFANALREAREIRAGDGEQLASAIAGTPSHEPTGKYKIIPADDSKK